MMYKYSKQTDNSPNKQLTITPIDFGHDGSIPQQYHFENENLIPTFRISNIPKETRSLAIIMKDMTTSGSNHIHWINYNIDPSIKEIGGENKYGQTGKNSRTLESYEGANAVTGRHRYRFTIYTLKEKLQMEEGYSSKELRQLINDISFNNAHIDAYSEKVGDFSLA